MIQLINNFNILSYNNKPKIIKTHFNKSNKIFINHHKQQVNYIEN